MEKRFFDIWQKRMCGSLVGLVNGLFGGGGGMIVVPLLSRETGEKEAHATAILVILPISVIALLVYLFHETLPSALYLPVSIGATIGAWIGTSLLCYLNARIVRIVFSVLMLFAGVWMVL